jgi:thiol-disulfide isomerase/thioredoxin
MRRALVLYLLVVATGWAEGPALTPVTSAELNHQIRNTGAKVVVVNMWATWCGPCREEFPDIVKLQRAYAGQGVKVLFVSWDMEAATAKKFLAEQGVDFPSFIKQDSESDQKFIEAVAPQWTGVFPATIVCDGTGAIRQFWEGKRKYQDFESAVKVVLESKPTGGTK